MMYVYEPEECGLVFPHYFVIVYGEKTSRERCDARIDLFWRWL